MNIFIIFIKRFKLPGSSKKVYLVKKSKSRNKSVAREDEGAAFSLLVRKEHQGSPHFPLNEVSSMNMPKTHRHGRNTSERKEVKSRWL